MSRIFISIILSMWLMFLGFISYGVGDYRYVLETWLTTFTLPIWSVATIGLWYDIGRLFIGTLVDNPTSKTPTWIRSILFIVWMSVVFTYISWIHVSLQVIPLLIVIPIIAIPFSEWLTQDWSLPQSLSRKQITALIFWAAGSYLTYWVLTFIWIIFRVSLMEVTSDGSVFYIQ